MKILLMLSVLLLPVASYAQAPVLKSVAPKIDQITGVYKSRFKNGTVDGQVYTSENILEVVKVTDKTAYVRIHSEFYNGHSCDLWGIADLELDALVYHGPDDYEGKPCALKFTVNTDGIILNDANGACRSGSCGARGGYGYGNSVDYPFKARRPIRYMARLLASSEYADAVKAHAARK